MFPKLQFSVRCSLTLTVNVLEPPSVMVPTGTNTTPQSTPLPSAFCPCRADPVDETLVCFLPYSQGVLPSPGEHLFIKG